MHRPTESPNSPASPTNREASCEDNIEVALGERSYQILLSSGKWMDSVAKIQAALPDLSHALVISDQAVDEAWSAPVIKSLRRTIRCDAFQVPSGESSKSLTMLGELWGWMHGCGADRRSVVLAIGGGVIGDLAGFAAASYARGIRLVQMPTTLLSQVDSSVGGKTGINLAHGKNMVGAFWQPSLVLIDTETLTTLPQRTYLSGLAEVIKYGVIEDAEFFAWLERNAAALVARDADAIRHAVATSCRIKASVVANDERETSGRRAILNYGHTFAHAIEATAGYGRWLHGEAVAMGMEMAASLAQSLGSIDETFVRRQRDLITACSLPTSWADADPQAMIAAMRTDKKVAHSNLRFILPTRIGQVEMVTCNDTAAIARAIESRR
ncbi:MAG: 3-dehydroquinate synthase [Planctomycetaceae bacterium]